MSRTAAVMLQGTGSDVGKSVLVAGLCRLYANRGLRVRPFKAQNMSNNAAVTHDGGEIGRAQALQALACRVPASIDMNPVLIKPESDTGAQLVVHGRVVGRREASAWPRAKGELMEAVLESWERVRADCDLVIVEGAGSPSEINLRAGDIANMGFARAANVPVVLVGDIDRGGVIASVVGTRTVLDPKDAAMIQGFLINRFRGDVALFDDGLVAIERLSGWPSLGVVPWLACARRLPAEDAVVLDAPGLSEGSLKVAVPMLSRIANFDDVDALAQEPGVCVEMVPPGSPLPGNAALVVLPGTKSTLADLAFFRAQGWDIDLAAHVRRGGHVLGLCGGYQMLGRRVSDPDGVEGPAGSARGLGLLDVETVLGGDKRTVATRGTSVAEGIAFEGYEIHVGRTSRAPGTTPLLRFADGTLDGAVDASGRIAGCYVHGLLDGAAQRAAWLARLGAGSDGVDQAARTEAALDELAHELERVVDVERLLRIARAGALAMMDRAPPGRAR